MPIYKIEMTVELDVVRYVKAKTKKQAMEEARNGNNNGVLWQENGNYGDVVCYDSITMMTGKDIDKLTAYEERHLQEILRKELKRE